MSIIIRLQNLPWSANSLDIRRYFDGLGIPEGGVHIVGGEKGDAFIAFLTDEDARQAMERDTGKIKDGRIKLLLSSRAEMQKVIEMARNAVVVQPTQPAQPPKSNSLAGKDSIVDRKRTSPERRRSRDRDKDKSSMSKKASSSRKRSRSRSPRRSSNRDKDRDTNRRSERSTRNDRRRSEDGGTRSRDENSRSSLENGDNLNRRNIGPSVQPPTLPTNTFPGPVVIPNNRDLSAIAANLGFSSLFPIVQQSDVLQSVAQGMDRMIDPSFAGLAANRMALDAMNNQRSVDNSRDRMDKNSLPVWQNNTPLSLLMAPTTPSIAAGGYRELDILLSNAGASRQTSIDRPLNDLPPGIRGGRDLHSNNRDRDRYRQDNEGNSINEHPSNRFSRFDNLDGDMRGGKSHHRIDQEFDQRDFRGRAHHHSGGFCVEVRGLPFNVVYKEIRDFFRGCYILSDGIKIINDDVGNRIGQAFIRFSGERDVQEGLRKHNFLMGKNRIEIFRCPENIFEQAIDSYIPRNNIQQQNINALPMHATGPREEDLVVIIKGLPYSCKEEDVIHFFDGLGILDVFLEYDHQGRAMGTGFVEFGSPEDMRMAMSLNGSTIGHRFITLSVGSKDMMMMATQDAANNRNRHENKFKNDSSKDPSAKTEPPTSSSRHPSSEQSRTNPSKNPLCMSMRNMPLSTTDKDIYKFFEEVRVVPMAIHIMLDPAGKTSGDAFIELAGPRDVESAMKKNGDFLGNQPVILLPLTFEKMNEHLGCPPLPPTPATKTNSSPTVDEDVRTPIIRDRPANEPTREPLINSAPRNGDRRVLMESPGDILKAPRSTSTQDSQKDNARPRGPEDRSRTSDDRSRTSEDRSRTSEDRSRMSEDRSRHSDDRSRNSDDRSRNSDDRSRMSEERARSSDDRSLMTDRHSSGKMRLPLIGGGMDKRDRLPLLGGQRDNFGGDGDYPEMDDLRYPLENDMGIGFRRDDQNSMDDFHNNGPHIDDEMRGNMGNDYMGDMSAMNYGPMHPRMQMMRQPRFHPGMMGGPFPGPMGPRIMGMGPPRMIPPGGELFCKPGCVLGASNIPFRATVDEIISFFEGFCLNPENIIRRYDQFGRATGDARIAFHTPDDANRALTDLSGKVVGNRPIMLFSL